MRSQLKKIEDLGAAMEEALILDNKYTEHSTVGLAQQWDQLDQLGMRMQHNLEQQIQARYQCVDQSWGPSRGQPKGLVNKGLVQEGKRATSIECLLPTFILLLGTQQE